MRNLIDLMETIYTDEDETPADQAEQAQYQRVRALEKKIEEFCQKSFGWSFYNASYAVSYDPEENEISISPDEEEVTLEHLNKLSVLGEHITVTAGSKAYALRITIRAHAGLDIQ